MKLFVFNSTWIIDKLKLDKGFPEETINLNVTMGLTIATIVIGGLIFVDALPMLCKQIFTFFQQKTVFSEDPQFGWMIFYFVKTMIGYLLMTNSRYVVGYIHKNADDNQA
ncbi:hypothetical protein [Gaoshiqia sp. Z1-71]|uniref:hypothetical protein n=1 Tax=Gaoshiqia hydrogeniformans TaxID=3290090 RepID=UPI003BF8AA7D